MKLYAYIMYLNTVIVRYHSQSMSSRRCCTTCATLMSCRGNKTTASTQLVSESIFVLLAILLLVSEIYVVAAYPERS